MTTPSCTSESYSEALLVRRFPREAPLFRGGVAYQFLNYTNPLPEPGVVFVNNELSNSINKPMCVSHTADNHDYREGDVFYPTIFEVLCNLQLYGINPNRFDKLFHVHRRHLGLHVSVFDGKDIPPNRPRSPISVVAIDEECPPPLLGPQSGEISDAMEGSTPSTIVQQVVEFDSLKTAPWYDVISMTDSVREISMTDKLSIDAFFKRPVLLRTLQWSSTVTPTFDINVFEEFFSHPRIVNRITNFHLLKAKLRVKIEVNGNGFLYGRMLVTYHPYSPMDNVYTNNAAVPQDRILCSQLPHIFINPTTSTGGEMSIPFFWHEDTMCVSTNSFTEVGTLEMRVLNTLKHANDTIGQCTISVYAWAEEIELSHTTSKDTPVLAPQSGEVDEVNRSGVISGPAMYIARCAAVMKGIPQIAPMAMATEIGATAIASIAKVFGFSRPTLTHVPEPYRSELTSSLSLVTVGDRVQKLTLDDKQELSIDTRIAGLDGSDPLSIQAIATRESYLTTFSWDYGTAPKTLLWNCRVNPMMYDTINTPPKTYFFTACAMAALPFSYWRGTMRYRFQIVKSAYHKGRLAIVFDPHAMDGAGIEMTTQYTKIVDISECEDIVIEVGWAQNVSTMPIAVPGDSYTPSFHFSTGLLGGNAGVHNGVIAVYVLNEMAIPNPTLSSDVQVNVFVSAGDDFEVFNPSEYYSNFVLKPQSGDVLDPQSGIVGADIGRMSTDMPVPPVTHRFCPSSVPKDLTKVYFGESVASLRSLLKRYTHSVSVGKTSNGNRYISGRFFAFPLYRGNVANAVHTTAAAAPYNYTDTHLLHLVRMCFMGSRGSIRWKIIPRQAFQPGDYIYVERAAWRPALTNSGWYQGEEDYLGLGNATAIARSTIRQTFFVTDSNLVNNVLLGAQGLAVSSNHVNGAIEFEVPYVNRARFTPGRDPSVPFGVDEDNGAFDFRIGCAGKTATGTPTEAAIFDFYCAAGEDFQVYFYAGPPRLYLEKTAPV